MGPNDHATWLHSWGRVIYRHRKSIVVAWCLLFCGLLPFAFKLPSLLQHNGFTPKDSPSQIGVEKFEEGLGLSAASLDIVIISQEDENLTTGPSQKRIMAELSHFEPFPMSGTFI